MSEKVKVGEQEFDLPFQVKSISDLPHVADASGNVVVGIGCIFEGSQTKEGRAAKAGTVAEALNALFKPIDMILFCPKCNFQHIDAPEPENCKNCGFPKAHTYHSRGDCSNFAPWLNEPHKKHRCHKCNNVWKPANVPTNGVAELENAL